MVEVLEILGSNPTRLATTTAGVGPDALHEPLEPGGWSARDILAHLRACDRTWGAYIDRILDQDHPSFRYESPRGTIRKFGFLAVPFAESLDAFTVDRARRMDRLRDLGPAELARSASVKVSGGRVETWTAFGYAQRLVQHELEHVEHLEREMASLR